MRRLSVIVLSLILVVPMAAGGGWLWLTRTESGARWMLHFIEGQVPPGSLDYRHVAGVLSSGMELRDVRFAAGAGRIDAQRVIIGLDADLVPPALNLKPLEILQLNVVSTPGAPRETPAAREAGDMARGFALPIPVRARDARIRGFSLLDADGAPLWEAELIEFSVTAHDDVAIERLAVETQHRKMRGSGEFGLLPPHSVSGALRGRGDVRLDAEFEGGLGDFSVTLDVMKGVSSVTASGSIRNITSRPEWNLEFTVPQFQWPLDTENPDLSLSDTTVKSSGVWPQFDAELDGELRVELLGASRLQVRGSGGIDSFEVERLELDGPGLELSANGLVSWSDGLEAAISAELKSVRLSRWVGQWPAPHPLTGRVEANWDGARLLLSDLDLAVVDAPTRLNGRGTFDLQEGVVEGRFSWSDAQWPVDEPTPRVYSERGTLELYGNPGDWRIEGNVSVAAADMPDGQLALTGSGDSESLALTIHEGRFLGGGLAGQLALEWSVPYRWSAQLRARGIKLTPLSPEIDGLIDLSLSAEGRTGPVQMAIDIDSLNGTLRGQPLTAEGRLHLEDKRLRADGFDIRYADASLFLDGDMRDPAGMEFRTDIPALSRLSDQFRGRLEGSGRLSLAGPAPRLVANLSGERIQFDDLSIGKLSLSAVPDPAGEAGSELRMEEVLIGGRAVESVSVRLPGSEPLERILATATFDDSRLELSLDGAVVDWSDPFGAGWRGALETLRLERANVFSLSLEAPSEVRVASDQLRVEESCFSGTRGAELCAAADWHASGALAISASLKAVPLALADLLIESDLEYSQILSGRFDWREETGREARAEARIDISPGTIRFAGDPEPLLQTGPGRFAFSLTRGRLQNGGFELDLGEAGEIGFEFRIPTVEQGGASPLQGTAGIALTDLEFVSRLAPLLDRTAGALRADLSLAGTVEEPAFSGTITVTDGELLHRASGLSLSRLTLSGAVDRRDRVNLAGTFQAGDGSGQIEALVDFREWLSPRLELAIRGEGLKLIDVPDLEALANPDVRLAWEDDRLTIGGRLAIPQARISPSEVPAERETESADVVVVAGEARQPESRFEPERDLHIDGELELSLGDGVRLVLPLAETRLTGTTRFSWDGDWVPLGDGNFQISGEIEAFGQLLRISKGRINFPGIPADNPQLNIRAEREIYGNSRIRQAGVMLTGTLRRPVIEPFTVPETNKQRAQTLLITGSDFNYEQSVGAVAVGTYIAPRFYVSYGIGIFEKGNIISARYELNRRFGIKATSGRRESGVDLNYRIDH